MMAQAIRNKEVRKICIDVEKVIMDCLCDPKIDESTCLEMLVDSIELNTEDKKNTSYKHAKYHQELIPINLIDQRVVYRNYMLKY
jgi:hypothetical protein